MPGLRPAEPPLPGWLHGRAPWHDSKDALAAWEEVRRRFTSEQLNPRKAEAATGGLWETQDGEPLLLLTWHH